MLTVTATLQEIPPDNQGGHTLATDEVSVESETYGEGVEALGRRVPEGWRTIFLRVDRPE